MSDVDVCIVQADSTGCEHLRKALAQMRFRTECTGDLVSALRFIGTHQPKIVLAESRLPDGMGLEICDWIRGHHAVSRTYFMLMTDRNEDLEEVALDRGADDYLVKPIDKRVLRARLRVGLRVWNVQERLRKAAITDGLTTVYNHDYGNNVVQAEVNRARRYGRNLAAILLDIDHFKAVNDTFGHMAGNQVLVDLSRILKNSARAVDTIVRFGGEEFLVILPESDEHEAAQAAERMRAATEASLRIKDAADYPITASFGVADLDNPRVNSASSLVDVADRAMYHAKHCGRNRVVRASRMDERTVVEDAIQSSDIESLRRQIAVLSARTKDAFLQSVRSLVQTLDERDAYTSRHSTNVAYYAEQVAIAMGCSQSTVHGICNAALLHDIGKVGIPDRILLKGAPLNDIERQIMQQVPLIGTRIVDHLRILEREVQIIRHQREFFDGSGNPDKLCGEQIPIGSRILLAADAFDAMTTDRVYRARRPIEVVLAELRRLAGKQFDPAVVASLEQCFRADPECWQRRIDDTIAMLQGPCTVAMLGDGVD